MITFTKEQLIASAHARIEFAEMMLAGELEPLKERTWSIELELARIALASLEAEERADPVAKVETVGVCWYADNGVPRKPAVGTELFSAPPAPVVSAELRNRLKAEGLAELVKDARENAPLTAVQWETLTNNWFQTFAGLSGEDDACRAAMLQGADGNSPVIPDGWVACSERMPDEDGNYWGWWSESKRQGPVWFIKSELQAQFQSSEITHWMPLPAAPQQEVNP